MKGDVKMSLKAFVGPVGDEGWCYWKNKAWVDGSVSLWI